MSRQPSRLAWLLRWLSLSTYGLVTSTLFRADTPPRTMRARFERFAPSRESLQQKYPKLRFESHTLGALHVESVRALDATRCVVMHLHGGAFVFGSAASYRNRAMRLSFRFAAEVFVPDYRLAPEHPFPAALDDALVAYQYVRALRPGVPILLSGDSAGGGLVLSLLIRLRELGTPLPSGALLLSPWTDLTVSGEPADAQRSRDRWLTRAHLTRWARYYAGASDPRTPWMSPLFADLSGLPPLLVLAGADEILCAEATRAVARAQAAGSTARLLVGRRMQHDWPLTLPWLEESRDAWQAMCAFVDERCLADSRHLPLSSKCSRPS